MYGSGDEECYVTASGVRLRVAEAGKGPPVILIHGLFVDHTSWDLVMPEL